MSGRKSSGENVSTYTNPEEQRAFKSGNEQIAIVWVEKIPYFVCVMEAVNDNFDRQHGRYTSST